MSFWKKDPAAPPGAFAWEAAGLAWLAEAVPAGGVPVVQVREVGPHHLGLAWLHATAPDVEAARTLGRRLARTHRAGAATFGCGPPGWEGDGFFGPLGSLLPMSLGAWPAWGAFYAEARLAPMVRLARDRRRYDAADVAAYDRVERRLLAGEFDTGAAPARIHGDLWAGNVVWTEEGAVLVDPAAHGGHAETDLALLALFGAPHLEAIRAGYQEVTALADGWQERVGLHQLHCVLVHAVLFGRGYAAQALAIARSLA